jgi:hypothetical protein
MTKFYNREPWNMLIGLSYVVLMFLMVASVTSPWVLAIPFLLWAYFFVKLRVTRMVLLWRKGYFSGRRVRGDWIYEERHGKLDRSLSFRVENTEPGHYEIFFPTDHQWQESVPPWAQDRREEIAHRVAEGWKPNDFHLPESYKTDKL